MHFEKISKTLIRDLSVHTNWPTMILIYTCDDTLKRQRKHK